MALYLEISVGRNSGERTLLRSGLKIGRTQGDIIINDAKASATHVLIEKDPSGRYFAKDLDSTNGIKINGLRTKHGLLEAGATLQVGKTLFTVIKASRSASSPAKQGNRRGGSSSDWLGQIERGLKDLSPQSRPPHPLLGAFAQALELNFIEGLQAEARVVLGYGPRSAGSECWDIELLDESAPAIAFEIHPNSAGEPVFSTQHPRLVQVNEEGLETRTLYAGDTIRIGKTLIRVDFL